MDTHKLSASSRGATHRHVPIGLIAAVAIAACGSASSTSTQSAANRPPAPSITTPALLVHLPAVHSRGLPPPPPSPFASHSLPAAGDRCGPPNVPATPVSFSARGGARLDGVLVGRGPIGVVLVHQFPADLCGWWQYAVYLAQRGFEAMPIDLRCFGRSTCPKADQDDPVGDLTAAAHVLLRSGAHKVAVIGASLGGTVAVIAGAQMSPRPSAVVDLSGELDDGHMLGPGPALNAAAAAPALLSPSLFVTSQTDVYSPVPDMQAVYRLTGTRLKRLIVEPSDYGHGWDMLTGTYTTWSPLANQVAGFLIVASRK